MMAFASSLVYFVLAGLAEIGGGYLVWLWIREGASAWWGLAGAALLVAYGFIPTLQPAGFGRVYAAYGGIFIVLSLIWGWALDGAPPDRWDIVGAALAIGGAGIMMYMPRS